MTVLEIIQRVSERKPISRNRAYVYLNELKIKPVGRRQRPARYPDDSADRILDHLGLPHVVTMPQLRNARHNSRRATR